MRRASARADTAGHQKPRLKPTAPGAEKRNRAPIKRERPAAAAREGDKVLSVKSAEAEAESKYLAGVGVARQRKAIVDGLKNSISDFTSNEQIKGASSKDVVDLLLITQYFDMLNAIGTRPDTQTVFIDEDGE